ncbi:MAG: hypothetical protein ACRD0Y_09320, partial [Terriglobales bacterium]
MIKVLNQYVPRHWALLVGSETALILLTLLVALGLAAGGGRTASLAGLVSKAVLITVVCQLALHYCDLYTPGRQPDGAGVVLRVLDAMGVASLLLALVYWLAPGMRVATGLIVGAVMG